MGKRRLISSAFALRGHAKGWVKAGCQGVPFGPELGASFAPLWRAAPAVQRYLLKAYRRRAREMASGYLGRSVGARGPVGRIRPGPPTLPLMGRVRLEG